MVKHSANLDEVFYALADPTRRAMLDRLSHGEARVTELAAPHEMSLPAISKHLKVLESAGLVVREKDGRIHRMNLNTSPMKAAAAWLERYRVFWEHRFDAIEKLLSKPPDRKA